MPAAEGGQRRLDDSCEGDVPVRRQHRTQRVLHSEDKPLSTKSRRRVLSQRPGRANEVIRYADGSSFSTHFLQEMSL